MSRPTPGSFAEELYAKLEPFHRHTADGREYTDEELGWPLLVFYGMMAKRWQRIHEITSDTDEGEGWTEILDLDRTADDGLPYLSQFKGVVLLDGLTPAQQRERIREVDGFQRCTAEAIKLAAKRRLHVYDTIRNQIENPSAEVDDSTWLGVGATVDRTTDEARAGDASFRVTSTAGGDVFMGIDGVGPMPGTAPGEIWSGGAYFQPETTPRLCYFFIQFLNGVGASLSAANASAWSVPGEWTRVTVDGAVAPAAAEYVQIFCYVAGTLAGENHYVDDVNVDESPTAHDYFSGDTPEVGGEWITWDGIPNASTSTKKIPDPEQEPTVYLNEREGGSAYHIGVVTLSSETRDPVLTFRDIVEQKPWGFLLNYQVVDAWGYQILKVAFDDYGEVKVHYADYEGLKENDPPAPSV